MNPLMEQLFQHSSTIKQVKKKTHLLFHMGCSFLRHQQGAQSIHFVQNENAPYHLLKSDLGD